MAYDDLGEAAIAAHDRQRQLPDEAHRALIGGLCSHLRGRGRCLRGRGRCLDAGVGTGRVALPLVASGISVVGVDLSREAAIARLEHNPFARPSGIDQAALRRAAIATRVWARERFGSLDEPRAGERVITFRIYRLGQETMGRA